MNAAPHTNVINKQQRTVQSPGTAEDEGPQTPSNHPRDDTEIDISSVPERIRRVAEFLYKNLRTETERCIVDLYVDIERTCSGCDEVRYHRVRYYQMF